MGEGDVLYDRRRLRRLVSWWRVAAVLAVLAAIGVGAWRFDAFESGPHVARISISGLIVSNRDREEAIQRLARRAGVRALIVRIDSPGGTLAGSEALYRRLREVAERMPVVAVMGELAASGGYMTALGADHIVAREGTLTGSIGVIMQGFDASDALRALGIRVHSIKSDPLKAVPNPFEPLTPEGRAAIQAVVDDAYDQFLRMVVERRGLERERARQIADGRIYTGRQAREAGLVDALGGEERAREFLRGRGVANGLPVHDYDIESQPLWRELIAHAVAGLTGRSYFLERFTLDGLVAVWFPGRLTQ